MKVERRFSARHLDDLDERHVAAHEEVDADWIDDAEAPSGEGKVARSLFEEHHYVHLLADYLYDKGDYVKAEEVYDHILRHHEPRLVEYATLRKTNALEKQGKVASSIVSLESSISKKNRSIKSLLFLSSLYQRDGRPSMSLPIIATVLEREPRNSFALHLKGHALDDLRRYGEAVVCYEALQHSAPRRTVGFWHAGVSKCRLGSHDTAVVDFEQAYRIDAKDVRVLNSLVVEYEHLDRPAESMKYLRIALKLEPRNANLLDSQGVLYTDFLNQYSKGVKSFDKALSLEPGSAKFWYNKGVALLKSRRFSESLHCNEEATKLDPPNPQALMNAGICLSQLGRITEALDVISRSLEIDKRPWQEIKGFLFSESLRRDSRFRELVESLPKA